MKRLPWLVPVVIALSGLLGAAAQSPYESVDPMIGTGNGGNTFPGATLPFGMIQWSPDTGTDTWYDYTASQIYGFSLTHLSGSGCTIYQDFPVLPWAGDLTVSPDANRALYTQAFDHTHEEARPGYYALTLANGVQVEMTVTERAGIARFRFPAGVPARLLLNAGGSANSTVVDRQPNNPARALDGYTISIDGTNAVSGEARAGDFCNTPTRYTAYMAAQFSKPFVRTEMWQDDTVEPDAKVEDARHAGALLDFGNAAEVEMRVGVSFLSVEGAQTNLNAEIPAWDFERVREHARQVWSETLGRFEADGGTTDQRTIFYTGLYHTLLSPNVFSDRGGEYTGFDGKIHEATNAIDSSRPARQYANFSDWDIYRDVIQLHAMFDPQRASDEAQSLVNDAEQSGWLPRWPAANDVTYVMNGDSPTLLLANEYAFGARNFDTNSGLQYMLKAANQPGVGPHGESERPFLQDYQTLGYVPVDSDDYAASRTLEYVSDDFAIAQMAAALGDKSDAAALLGRAGNWQNLLDPESLWIRPKNANGSWQQGFDAVLSVPRISNTPPNAGPMGFQEGNSPQYSFMIPFDYARLIPAMGGNSFVGPRLDSFFSKLICWNEPCFNMANEPDFVVPYIYEYTDQPWKTDDVIARIEQQTFSATPDGLPGNDDLGATSGVYVWDALGLFPGVPGVGGFFLGTPMFPRATVHFGSGRTLVVTRDGKGVYVAGVTVNGKPHASYWLPLDEIPENKTTTLHFTMQETAPTSTSLAAPPAFIQ